MFSAALIATGQALARRFGACALGMGLLWSGAGHAQAAPPAPAALAGDSQTTDERSPLVALGGGDVITVNVFGRPELTTTAYVADDGSVSVPLAGKVQVAGLSPQAAGQRIADALRKGQYLVNPQVNVTLTEYQSQLLSVLGEVNNPGRFPLRSKTTVLDAIAQAGGISERGSDTVFVLRQVGDEVRRFPLNLDGLVSGGIPASTFQLRSGDSVFVPKADQFFIYGEVRSPNAYKLEPGTTVVQAISRGGGVTDRGSDRRIEIERKRPDGTYEKFSAELTDPVQPNDVIRVKERFF